MKRKEFLLIVPALLLAIVAAVLPRLTAKPLHPLVIDRVLVAPYPEPALPRAKGADYRYLKYRDDTKVVVSGHYEFSWMDRYVNKMSGAFEMSDVHLVDAKGRKYYALKSSDSGSTQSIDGGISSDGSQFQLNYRGINLRQISPSAGTISLKSNYIYQDGSVLPFSVVVRK